MPRLRWLVLALAACSQPAPAPKPPVVATVPADAAVTEADARVVSQDEKLAAIQKAMNELDEAVQGCWAAAATDRYDIAGELVAQIDISGGDAAGVAFARNTVRNERLTSCVQTLLTSYRWAPPLYGETIQLPFQFQAPDGQSVIDRQLVTWHGQQSTSVAVLIDENNTGNPAASILEVAIAPRATTQMRVADRAELWFFLGEAEIKSKAGTATLNTNVPAGGMMFVPKGAAREVIARRPDMHAVVVLVPGGREGTARAGALPTATAASGASLPTVLPLGKQFGPATIFLEPSVVKGTPLAASILQLAAGATVPEHVHANETELLYVLEGAGTMTINGQEVAITPTSVVQVPKNTKHAFTATSNVRALQLYTPPGPEQRFKK